MQNQLPVITPPPPPPPYPGPPPPYPSQLKQQLVPQQLHHLSGSPSPNVVAVSNGTPIGKLVHHPQIPTNVSQLPRRPLLLQEQPLLLEDLVEQEKREQGKQSMLPGNQLPQLTDLEFERLRADVLSGSAQTLLSSQGQSIQNTLVQSNTTGQTNVKLTSPGNVFDLPQQQTWQQANSNIQSSNVSSVQVNSTLRAETPQRTAQFNIPLLPAPPEPPENITTEQDRQDQQRYELWLVKQNEIVELQKKHYESEIGKLRKSRKSLNSKQRGLKKQLGELPERDAQELQRINIEMPQVQKSVESSRKLWKQHLVLIQEYKNKHPNFNCLPDNNNATSTSNAPINVVASSMIVTSNTTTNVMVSQHQQKLVTSVVGTINRPSSTAIVSQNQTDEMFNTSTSQETLHTSLQSPTTITSQIRANSIRPQEQIIRYPSAPVRLLQTTVRTRPALLALQMPADIRQSGTAIYQGLRNTLKTQPLIVSTVPTSSSGNLLTSTTNIGQGNTFQLAPGQEKTLQQYTPEQQRIIIQRQFIHQHRATLSQQNIDQNALAQQRRRMVHRQAVYQQVNPGPRVSQFAQPASPAPPQSPLVPSHSYSLHSPSPSHFNQPPTSPMAAPSQSPRHVSQFVHPSNSPVPSQSPQPPNSPMSMASPRHVSQFVHPNSPVPPQSPIYTSQAQYIPHAGSPIPARSPVLVRRPPSTESFVQDNQQAEIHSGMNYNQDSYNNGNCNGNNNASGGSHSNGSSGGGGNTISYVNTIPIPEEFRRLGIKPGLLGGSPAWNEKTENSEIKSQSENNVNRSPSDEIDAMKPSTSFKTPTTVSSQFYNIEDDLDSRDSSLFITFPSKLCVKQESPDSPGDFETSDFQSCITPKTSDDSMELPMYKDVPLMESCKSEENSLGIGDFPSSIDDTEMSEPLVLESGSLDLTLDSSDLRGEDLLGLASSADLLVLNMDGDHSGIMDDTSGMGHILYLDKVDDDLHKTEDRVIITDVTDEKSEDTEVKAETSANDTRESNLICKDEFVHSENSEAPSLEIKDENVEEKSVEIPSTSNNSIEEMHVEKSPEIKDVNSSAITSLPIRTTSVLQMTPSLLHSSTSKEMTVTYSNVQQPVYIEHFHSYVKKFPKSCDSISVKEESSIEKDKQLFDETLLRIKTEKMVDIQEETNIQGRNTPVEENKIVDYKSPIITSSVQYCPSSSVITKDAKVVPVTSAPQIKKESSPTSQTSQIPTSNAFTPRVRSNDDSQNVLLKQLLQNSGSASITHSTMTQHVTKPSPSPSPTYRSPPLVTTTEATFPTISQMTGEIVSASVVKSVPLKIDDTIPLKEVNFTSTLSISSSSESLPANILSMKQTPISSTLCVTSSVNSTTRMHMTTNQSTLTNTVIKQENMITTSRKDVAQSCSTSSGLILTPTSVMSPMQIEIKKESLGDELASPQSRVLDAGDTPNSISGDSSSGSLLDAQDLKKLKRRQYQAKRRQSQCKEHTATIPKKRARKTSKTDEDYNYDSFVDALMAKLRQLPILPITEPLLTHNYAVCLPFGSGDATKISIKTWINGELNGSYESLTLPGHDDTYNTEPFGDEEPLTPSAVPPTTRGFYNEEFSPLNLEADYEDRRLELARLDREADTPDSVMSSSSPECIIPHIPARFAGLRLIDENGSGVDSEEDEKQLRRISPVIPLVMPLALRPRIHYQPETDKENCGKYSPCSIKSRHSPPIPLKDSGNLSVTLTLSSEAAQDIVGVLKNLATVLNIPPPASYKIIDRIPSPNRINPFGNKFNDDLEEAELQSYFGCSTKFCQHCKIQISDFTSIKKKASEVPFIVQDGISEDLLFCSTSCYLQMLLLVPPVISEHKVSSSDDGLLNDLSPCKKPKLEKTICSSEIQEAEQAYKVTDLSNNMDISDTEKNISAEIFLKGDLLQLSEKKFKGIKYRTWSFNTIPPPKEKFKRPSEKEMTETLFRMGITVTPAKMPEDMRTCIFCHQVGDGVADGPSRLLNCDVDKWAHLNCCLWPCEVYETVNGALMHVDTALQQGMNVTCTYCLRNGATLKCCKNRCSSVYHLSCAVKDECVFRKDKKIFCKLHFPKGEKDHELTTLAVYRRVYIDRDENRQIASIVQHAELTHLMRIGSLIFLNVGQLLPHQLQEFHTSNYIYPVGYKVIRFYWSMRIFNKRCQYVCSIHDVAGRPEFRILVQEPGQDDIEFRGASPKAVWTRILEPLTDLRLNHNSVKIYPRYISGEDLFGLTEPAIVRILENLPGIETLSDYRFKYGKNPLLELPLAVNPSGCARGEPKIRGPTYKRAFTQRTSSIMPRPVLTSSPLFGDISCSYSKHFVQSKSSQYKRMKQEWRNYVYLARSKIQGLGLYAARDIDKHTMVIEYIGEIIRSQLSDFREKQYEAKNRGVYMFRLDENRVVDATICGGLARYINHSCNPNCVTEKVEVDREYRIIICSKRKIARGEELSYDYQFDIEDDSHKIPCLCGASNCRKWMN